MLVINARNEGEGAYEAELFVMIPEEADYVGIERSNKVMPCPVFEVGKNSGIYLKSRRH